MTLSTQGYKFAVSSVDFQRDTHVRINIKKRHERIYFKTLTSDENVNISYLESAKCSPSKNLSIVDKSRSLPENAFFGDEDYVLLYGRVFTTRAKEFVVTDVFVTETATQAAIPLFYYHKFQYFNPDLTDFDDRELLTVEFVDVATMTPFTISEYYTDTTNGKLYNNLENTYDSITGAFDVVLVRYSVRVTESGVSSTYSYQELLNNQKAFIPATVQDLDDWGNLLTGVKAYIMESVPGGVYYRISLPPATTFAYKEISPSKIYVKPPAVVGVDDPWNVRIGNGEFMSAVRNGPATYRSSKYYIAEFLSQSFSPYYPFKYIAEEEATHITRNIIKVTRNIVDQAAGNFTIQVVVYDASGGSIEAGYTTDDNLVDTYIDTARTVQYKELITSVDELNGFIEINAHIPTDRKVLVSYYTDSDEYDFIDIDFNPLSNRDITNKKVVIYINPETVSTGALSQSLYYLEVDRLGRITYCSQADAGGIDQATSKLLDEDFNEDGSPRGTFYYDIPSTVSGLRARTTGDFAAYREDFSFVDKYTTESTLMRMTEATFSGQPQAELNLSENPGLFVLADIQTGESEHLINIHKADVRVPGGGIKPEYDAAAKLEEPEVTSYWDKEYPYPGRNTFMVELPQTLLKEKDGDYSYQQLKEIIGKHTDFSSYQVLRTYGSVDPVIVSGIVSSELLSGIVVSGIVQFVWTSYGQGVEYDLYMSTDATEAFTQKNLEAIIDESPTNSYTVSGLLPSITYYAYLEATKEGEVSVGPTVKFTAEAATTE